MYHKLLLRQLKRCNLNIDDLPNSKVEWENFLQHVNNAYKEADSDRYILERSQDVASREMQALNEELITTARLAGMTEIATNMLHNIGNVLNSVNVSATLINEKIDE